jgi:hypothetical protein
LGKRKSGESSEASSQQGSSRPSKLSRSNPISDEAANPFLDGKKEVPEDPFGPICYVRMFSVAHAYADVRKQTPSKIFQRMFHHKKLPYGVQYELARCVSHSKFKFTDIHVPDLDMFSEMKTNEKAAPLTLRTFLKADEDENEDGTQGSVLSGNSTCICLTLRKEDQFQALFLKEHTAKVTIYISLCYWWLMNPV